MTGFEDADMDGEQRIEWGNVYSKYVDWLEEQLDQFSIGGAPLGFWMAQQGSIICFVILLILYSFLMNKLDKEHGYVEEEEG